MKSRKKLKVVVVDKSLQQRGRLRDNITLQLFQPSVHCFANLQEAIAHFSGAVFDVIFMEAPDDKNDLAQALTLLKSSDIDSLNPKVCLTVPPSLQENDYVAQALVYGVDGFLFEPYAAEHLELLIDVLLTDHCVKEEDDEVSATDSGVLRMLLVDPTGRKSQHSKPIGRLMNIAKHHGQLAPMMKLEAFHVILHEKFLRTLLKEQRPIHPGELVKLMIDTGGHSYHSVSELSGIEVEEVARICAATSDLNEERAEAIARTLGETKSYWMKLQKEFVRYSS